jgi:cell division inhibitor SulA
MASSIPTRAIDRLRKAANLEPTKKNVELSDGTIFEMWVSPLTMAERERAQKQAKSDDANAFALQLLISVDCVNRLLQVTWPIEPILKLP